MSIMQFGFTLDKLIENKRVVREDVLEIKRWQESTTYPKLVEEQIALFLISCDYDQNYTKQTIEYYFKIKMGAPEIFFNRNVEKLLRISKVINVAVMPKRYQGSAIIVIKLKDTNYRNFDILSYAQLTTMTVDSILYDDPPESFISLTDSEGFTIMHLIASKRQIIKSFTDYNQYATPIKVKNMHMLNVNYIVYAGLSIIKPFFKSQFIDKIKFHRNDMVFDWVPKEYLPKEFGGDLESISAYHEDNLKRLLKLSPFFRAQDEQVYGKSL